MAITITATQSEVAVTLANTRMLLLTSALQQKNVTCTVTLLASKEAIYLCLAVNRFLAAEPLWSHQTSSTEQGRSDMQKLQQYLSPSQIKALCEKQ